MNNQGGDTGQEAGKDGEQEGDQQQNETAPPVTDNNTAAAAANSGDQLGLSHYAQTHLMDSVRPALPTANNAAHQLRSTEMFTDLATMNAANTNNQSNTNVFASNLQAQAAQEAYLRETRIRLLGQQLLQQQQQQEASRSALHYQGLLQGATDLGLSILHQPNARQPLLSNSNNGLAMNDNAFVAAMRLNPQLAVHNIGGQGVTSVGGGRGIGGHLPANILAGISNFLAQQQQPDFSSLSAASLRTGASRPTAFTSLQVMLAQQQQQQQQQSRSQAPVASHPAQPTAQAANDAGIANEEQEEMKDDEYFELFGFNDEDAVQVINESFPQKLYRMLYEVAKRDQENIVSWFPHGKAFIVKSPIRFVEEVMPKYFSTTRMASFQRQLNLYGFQRIDDGPEKGGFVHRYFQKEQRSLCSLIRRQTRGTRPPGRLPGRPPAGGSGAPVQAPAPSPGLPQNQQAQAVLQQLLGQSQGQADRSGGNASR